MLEKFLRRRPMDLQVRRAIQHCGTCISRSWGSRAWRQRRCRSLFFVGFAGSNGGRLELLSDVSPCRRVRSSPAKLFTTKPQSALGLGITESELSSALCPGPGQSTLPVDDLAAEQAGHFRQCWERCWHDLARRLLTFSRRANQARQHSIARPRDGGGVRDRTERAFAL